MGISLAAIIHPGVENSALQEVKELLHVQGSAQDSVITFTVKNLQEVLTYLASAQLSKRVLLLLGIFSKAEEVELPKYSWQEIFAPGMSYALELEHLSGGELRQQLSKKINAQLVQEVKKACGFSPLHSFKKPDVHLILQYTGSAYLLGVDLAGELQKRAYRIFTHHASFTGDVAAFLVRKTGFVSGEKLIVSWSKDGTVAIEAALYATHLPIHKGPFACERMPLFQATKSQSSTTHHSLPTTSNPLPTTPHPLSPTVVSAWDVSLQNIIAARKNAKLAGVYELVDFQKYSLEELDVKYGESVFDRVIFHLTMKDEQKLNEVYYQTKYILKPKGTVLFITRKQLDLPIPEGFVLLSEEELKRGDSVQRLWVLRKE